MNQNPLVSVIIPVFNRENTIKRALDSVLGQTYSNLEVILVDDGSSDDSVNIIKSYDDGRMRLVELHHNYGASHARNIGMEEARGDYIAFQDSDDEWYKNKLEIQIGYMLKNGFDAVFCPYLQCWDGCIRLVPDNNERRYDRMEADIRKVLSQTNVVGTPALVVGRNVINTVGFFDETLAQIEDYDYAIRIAKKYLIGFTPDPLFKAYIQGNSITRNGRGAEALIGILRKHPEFMDVESVVRTLFFSGYFMNGNEIDDNRIKEINTLTDSKCESTLLHYCATGLSDLERIQQKQYQAFVGGLKDGRFAVYGAGIVGKRVLYMLRASGLTPRCFVVTRKESDEDRVDEIPVLGIEDLDDRNISIIIAVGRKNRMEIVDLLCEKGFTNFACYCE